MASQPLPTDVDRLSAALAGRYRLERELGAGGMATIYLAEDLKHHRQVAIKALKPDLAAVLGPERFLREIEIAAKLNHPHILPLFDSGEADGVLYYVMPYVEGESLRERLNREKQLGVDEGIKIAREVADALDYAHGHDVVHRDIKPENILLGERHAVVADFGIARAISVAGGEKLTVTGVAVGTPEYMSPEQASGGRQVDGRSDVYALGCVLYEMLAGEPPFTGPTAEAVLRQHLTAPTPAVTAMREGVPETVTGAIQRALAKTPADRFRSGAEFAAALGHVGTVPTLARDRTAKRLSRLGLGVGVAVVVALGLGLSLGPLRRWMGPAPAGAKVRDWILVADFEGSADRELRRASRELVSTVLDQSTMVATLPAEQIRRGLALAGRPDTTGLDDDLARELAVRGAIRTVVTGRIDRVGATYSVLLRVLEADQGSPLVAENRIAQGEDDVIPTVDRVARALREGLGERATALQPTRPLIEVATSSFAAYRKYVEALRLRYDLADAGSSAQATREALAIDPDFAAAWILLGNNLEFARDSAVWALQEALRRPDRLTATARYEAEARIAVYRGDLPGALVAVERVLREHPNDLVVQNLRLNVLGDLQGYEAAVEGFQQLRAQSPFGLNQVMWANYVRNLAVVGRLDEARKVATRLDVEQFRLEASLLIALAAGDWARAESVSLALDGSPTVAAAQRPQGALVRASVHVVRGQVRRAWDALARAGPVGSVASLLLALATGSPTPALPAAGAELLRAVSLGLAGDSVEARAALMRLVAQDSTHWLVRNGSWPALAEVAIAAHRGDWNTVVTRGRPVIGLRDGPAFNTVMRWLLANAHEHLGHLDSAAAHLEWFTNPDRFDRTSDIFLYPMARPFAQLHLVRLYVRMGRRRDAQRHWVTLNALLVDPDAELAPLIQEARVALERAGGR